MNEKSHIKPHYMLHKNAFTLIELILAIVVISIAILALPTILLKDAQDQETNLVQEGILITATQVSNILTYPWDAQSSPLGGTFSTSQVLNVASGDSALDRNVSVFRVGHFQDGIRRRMTPADPALQRSASTIPTSAVTPPTNIADFNDPSTPVAVISNGALTDGDAYKKQYRVINTVSYINDSATYANNVINDFDFNATTQANSSNIKMIKVTTQQLNNTDPTTPVWTEVLQLTAYSANIGEAEFYKRRY